MKSLSKILILFTAPLLVYFTYPLFDILFSFQPVGFSVGILIGSVSLSLLAFRAYPEDASQEEVDLFIFRDFVIMAGMIVVLILGIIFADKATSAIAQAILLFSVIVDFISIGLIIFDILNAIDYKKELELAKHRLSQATMNNTQRILDDDRINLLKEMYKELLMEIELAVKSDKKGFDEQDVDA